MSISALSSSSAASSLSFLSRLSSTNKNSSNSTDGVRPPPPPDGGGFADAIADALKSIGISDTSTSTSSTDASAAASSSDSTSTTDGTDIAAALGSFLQSLMGALHAQNSGNDAPPPYSEQQGSGAPGGPGKLELDLQSLIAKLGSGSDSATTSTDGADSGDAVDQLESAFGNLLDKLGTSSTASSDSTSNDAATKLAAFLQALSAKVGGNGTSGNMVNTTV